MHYGDRVVSRADVKRAILAGGRSNSTLGRRPTVGGLLVRALKPSDLKRSLSVKKMTLTSGTKRPKSTLGSTQPIRIEESKTLIRGTQPIVRHLSMQSRWSRRFTYYLAAGNNPKVVRHAFSQRSWWVRSTREEANLMWSHPDEQLQLPSPCFISAIVSSSTKRCENRVPNSSYLISRKALFELLHEFYAGKKIFRVQPFTIYVDIHTPLHRLGSEGLWIIKPIQKHSHKLLICKGLDQAIVQAKSYLPAQVVNQADKLPSAPPGVIVQKYIKKPLLFHSQKCDIQFFVLVTCVDDVVKGYFYEEGYVRLAKKPFTLDDLSDPQIHETTETLNAHSQPCAKCKTNNKVSLADLNRQTEARSLGNIFQIALPKVRTIVRDTLAAFSQKVGYSSLSFELFSYEFLLDHKLRPWLLEINSNPSLDTSCALSARIVPMLIENILRIAVDPAFPSPFPGSYLACKNKFSLIFDSSAK